LIRLKLLQLLGNTKTIRFSIVVLITLNT